MRGKCKLAGGREGNIRLVGSHPLPESRCNYGDPAATLEREVTLRTEGMC